MQLRVMEMDERHHHLPKESRLVKDTLLHWHFITGITSIYPHIFLAMRKAPGWLYVKTTTDLYIPECNIENFPPGNE